MNKDSNFAIHPGEFTLDDMLIADAAKARRKMDPFSAALHNERMDVAAAYVRGFFPVQTPKPLRLLELLSLNGCVIAQCVAPDLDPEGKASIAGMVQNLIDHARSFILEMQLLSLGEPAGLWMDIFRALQWKLIDQVQGADTDMCYSVRATVDVSVQAAPVISQPRASL